MTEGMFKSFEHNHWFQEQDGETVMRDELKFSAPLGILGLMAEWVVAELPNPVFASTE